ncbi:hypothetical protein [Azospirillum soli]|uniref:hypothetical protein n=1 Tax=Azospirillum soli TaxID=1304799 RepID=UPI001AE9AA14|nr:hypothetical protein [Azospirillum soli]MBP2312743.1 hypothetical protein [Azospirillum soli]
MPNLPWTSRTMAQRREKGKIPHSEWSAIRTRHAAGESLASIARDYGCTGPAIRYIVNRPGNGTTTPAPASPESRNAEPSETGRPEINRRPAVAEGTPASARPEPVGGSRDGHRNSGGGASSIDPDLRWRVSSEIASFLAVFDSFLSDNSPEIYDELLGATDRLMRVAARTRIELERARASAEPDRIQEARPVARGSRSRAVPT